MLFIFPASSQVPHMSFFLLIKSIIHLGMSLPLRFFHATTYTVDWVWNTIIWLSLTHTLSSGFPCFYLTN